MRLPCPASTVCNLAMQAALADAKIPKVEVVQGEDPTGAQHFGHARAQLATSLACK